MNSMHYRSFLRSHRRLICASLLATALPILFSGALAGAQTPSAPAITFTPLPEHKNGIKMSLAKAVSADGSVVVGGYVNEDILPWSDEAFRWENGVTTGLGGLPGYPTVLSSASGVSADGRVVVGQSYSSAGKEAFRWENGLMLGLGGLPDIGTFSEAYAVSADGRVVVGKSHYDRGGTDFGNEGFIWENGAMKNLVDPPGSEHFSEAVALSADGKIVVGSGRFTDMIPLGGESDAVVWRNGEATRLGVLPNYKSSRATAISPDGSIIVGYSYGPGSEACRWENGVLTGLGDLPGYGPLLDTIALAISADGSVIAGAGHYRATLWRADAGMVDLQELAIARGATGLEGWTIIGVLAISADGTTLVGYGMNPQNEQQGYRLRLNSPGGFTRQSVSGKIALEGVAATASSRSLTFTFRPQAGGQPITFTHSIGGTEESRSFSFSLPPGQYSLAIQGAPYLRTVVPVNATGWKPTVLNSLITLTAGDVNGDNTVNLTDLVQLRANYGAVGSNLTGDLNGDGRVNLTDLVLLRANYGKSGQP